MVAINIHAVEFGELIPIIDRAACERPRFGMVMFDGRRDGRSRTELAVEVKRMAAFINAPPTILAAADEMRRFPKVLAVVADPDLPGLLVDAHAPRIAQAVGPVFRSRIGHPNKWVVL